MDRMEKKEVETILRTGKKLKGFTLLELLIGIAIMGIVLFTVFAGFYMSKKAYQKEEIRNDFYQQIRGFYMLLEDDLLHMIPDNSARWNNNSFSFTALKKEECKGLCTINYIFGGKEVYRMVTSLNEEGTTFSAPVLRNLRSYSIYYFLQNTWVSEVKKMKKGINPRGIKILLTFSKKGENTTFVVVSSLSQAYKKGKRGEKKKM